jgi:hypothetical protein
MGSRCLAMLVFGTNMQAPRSWTRVLFTSLKPTCCGHKLA